MFDLGRNERKMRCGARLRHQISLNHGCAALRRVSPSHMRQNAKNGLPLPSRATLQYDNEDSLCFEVIANKGQYGLRAMDRVHCLKDEDLTISFDEVALNQRMSVLKVSDCPVKLEVMGHVQHCALLHTGPPYRITLPLWTINSPNV